MELTRSRPLKAGSTDEGYVERARLNSELTAGCWGLVLMNLIVAGWSFAVLTAALPCSGVLCSLTTLGDRPLLQLALTVSCAAAMLAVAAMTDGLTRAHPAERVVLAVIGVVGVGAVLGVALVLLLVAAAITVVGNVLVGLVGGGG